MPPPTHYRVEFSGTIGTGLTPPEIFSFGVACDVDVEGLQPDRAALAARAAAVRVPAWNAIAPGIYAAARLKRVRVALVGSDGLTMRDESGAYLHGDHVTDQAGTGGAGVQIPQVALAATLLTAFPGQTGRGRFYIPQPIGNVQGDTLIMSEADRAAHQARAAAFVQAVSDTMQGDVAHSFGPVVVASGGSVVNSIPPGNRRVTGVRVGAAFDTIRSRRSALADTATPTAIT